MEELATRLAHAGWVPMGQGDRDGSDLELLVAAGIVKNMRFVTSGDGTVFAFATNTTSGRRDASPNDDPEFHVFTHGAGGEILFATAFRYKSNEGIDIRCTAYGHQEAEAEYLLDFEPQSILQSAREQAEAPEPKTWDLRNTRHPKRGDGHRWGRAEVGLLNADHISERINAKFPFNTRLAARSYIIPMR